MKKILLLIPELNAGGAERVLVTLANEWSTQYDVTILVFNEGRCFYRLADKVHVKAMNVMPKKRGIQRVLSIPKVELTRYKKVLKEIEEGNYYFVLSFCYTSNIISCLASARLKKREIFISERGDPKECGLMRRISIDMLYRIPSVLVCQNKVIKDYFINKGFKNKMVILQNPICFEDIPRQRPDELRPEIVTVGRLTNQKNHRLLIEAFNDIQKSYPEYVLKIYGSGPLKNELQNLIGELGLGDRVFLMGIRDRVMFEINQASFFVLPSNYEGFPNVLIEAMASGMPVISTRFSTGGADELIESEKNGYLVDVGDKKGMACALIKMIERKNEYKEIGERNRLSVQKYKADVIAEEWMNEIVKRL